MLTRIANERVNG